MKTLFTDLLTSCCFLFSQAQISYPLVTPGAKYYTDGDEIYYL